MPGEEGISIAPDTRFTGERARMFMHVEQQHINARLRALTNAMGELEKTRREVPVEPVARTAYTYVATSGYPERTFGVFAVGDLGEGVIEDKDTFDMVYEWAGIGSNIAVKGDRANVRIEAGVVVVTKPIPSGTELFLGYDEHEFIHKYLGEPTSDMSMCPNIHKLIPYTLQFGTWSLDVCLNATTPTVRHRRGHVYTLEPEFPCIMSWTLLRPGSDDMRSMQEQFVASVLDTIAPWSYREFDMRTLLEFNRVVTHYFCVMSGYINNDNHTLYHTLLNMAQAYIVYGIHPDVDTMRRTGSHGFCRIADELRSVWFTRDEEETADGVAGMASARV